MRRERVSRVHDKENQPARPHGAGTRREPEKNAFAYVFTMKRRRFDNGRGKLFPRSGGRCFRGWALAGTAVSRNRSELPICLFTTEVITMYYRDIGWNVPASGNGAIYICMA